LNCSSLAGPEPDRQVSSSSTCCARPPRARPKPSALPAKSFEHLRPPNAPTISETQAMPKASCSSLPVDQPGGKFLGDVWGHVVAPRAWSLREAADRGGLIGCVVLRPPEPKAAPRHGHPPNAKDIGFDSASVNTVLRTGLKLAGVTVVDQSLTYTGEEPPWSRASRWSGRPGSTSCSLYNAK
jgi:hypothetical protein